MDLSDVLPPSVARSIPVTVGFFRREIRENRRFFNYPLAELRMVFPIEISLPTKMLARHDRLETVVRIPISTLGSDVVRDILCQASSFGRLT